MSRSANPTYFIAKNASGSWSVTRPGKASQAFQTKSAAIKAAQQIVRESGGVLQISGGDGRMTESFTLGRSAMTKLNEVEGVVLTRAGQRTFKDFDNKDLTPGQRRAILRKASTTLAAGVKSTRSQGPRSKV